MIKMTSTILQRACSALAGLCLLAISWPGTAEARHLTPSEAQQRVVETLSKQSAVPGARKVPGSRSASDLQLVYTSEGLGADKAPAFYVFNNPASRSGEGNGFVIATADDRLRPVLGIATEGSFDATNIPSNVAWWLGEYEREIAAFLDSPATSAVSSQVSSRAHNDNYATWDAIEPLISTKWDQGEPYNSQLPDICTGYGDETVKPLTGCVATALAQIVKYHRLEPVSVDAMHYPYDFSKPEYDHWDQMRDEYTYEDEFNKIGPNFTEQEAAAVANLMLACGAAVNTSFGIDGSSAYSTYVPLALKKYFGFVELSCLLSRTDYFSEEWEKLIYDELADKRPVYYGGSSSRAGHAFVCDGYLSDGLFHINWGWGGDSDGYFALSALMDGYDGFNFGHEIVLCIPPVNEITPELSYVFIQERSLECTKLTPERAIFSAAVTLSRAPQDEVDYNWGVCIEDSCRHTVKTLFDNQKYGVSKPQGGYHEIWSDVFEVKDLLLAEGEYHVTPILRVIQSDNSFVEVKPQLINELVIRVDEENNYSCESIERYSKIELLDLELIKPVFNKEKDNAFRAILVNTGNKDYHNDMVITLYKTQGINDHHVKGSKTAHKGVTIPAGESIVFEGAFDSNGSITGITHVFLYERGGIQSGNPYGGSYYSLLSDTGWEVEVFDGYRCEPKASKYIKFSYNNVYFSEEDCKKDDGYFWFAINTGTTEHAKSMNACLRLYKHGTDEIVEDYDSGFFLEIPSDDFLPIKMPSEAGLYDIVAYDYDTKKEVSERMTISIERNADYFNDFELVDGSGIRIAKVNENGVDEVLLPEEVNGMPVVEIGDNLFKGNKNVTVIDIPSSVTEIGHDALRYTSNLQSLFLGSAQTFNLNYPQTVMYGTNPDLDIYVPEEKFNDFTGTKLSESYSVYKRITSLVAEETEVKMAVESEANISVPQTLLSDINPNFNVSVENPEIATVTLANGVINIKSKSAGRTNVIMKSAQPLVEPLSISVRVTKPGDPSYDLNEDGQVNVFDLTVLVDVIVSNTADVTLHDMNGDGEVNVFDLTELVNYIVGTPQSQNLSARSGHTLRELPLDLGCDGAYIAMQTDLRVSGEGKVRSVSLNPLVSDSHAVVFREVVPGVVRIMVYSFGNTPIELPDGEELLTLGIDGSAEISCEDAMFVTVGRTIYHVIPTGVQRVDSDSEVVGIDYYDMSGRRLSRQPDGICIRRVRYADGSFTTQKVTQ